MRISLKRILAVTLAVTLTMSGLLYGKAGAAGGTEGAPVIGDYGNLAEAHSELAGEKEFTGGKENFGPVDLSEDVNGNTWYISSVVRFTSLNASNGPRVAFAQGTYTEDGTVTNDLTFQLEIRGGSNLYVLWRAPAPMWQYGNELPHGDLGVTLETEKDYVVTFKVEDGDKLSFWLDDTLVIDGRSLSEMGITNLKPIIGWRAYGSTGSFRDIQIWDGVTTAAETETGIRVFDPEKDINAAEYETLTTKGETKYQEGLEFGPTNTYYYSGDIDYGEGLDYSGGGYSGEMGVSFIIGSVKKGTEEYPLLVEHRPASSATRVFVKLPSSEINLGPSNIWRGDLWHRQKYHYDIAYRNGKVTFYVNGNAITENLNVKKLLLEKGYTDVIPNAGVMALKLPQEATVSNIKIWGDVTLNREVITEADDLTFDNGQKILFGNSLESAGGERYAIGGYTVGEDGEVRELTADFRFGGQTLYSGIGFSFGTLTDDQGEQHDLYFTLQQTGYDTKMRWMCYEDGTSDSDLIAYSTYWSENLDIEKTYNLKISYRSEKLSVSVNENEVLNSKVTALNRPSNREGGSYTSFTVDKMGIMLGMAASVSNVKVNGVGVEERLNLCEMENGAVEIYCDKPDLSEGTRIVAVPKAAENYNVVAGTLKYTADEASHHINNIDEQTGGNVFVMPKGNVSLECGFAESGQQNISIAIIGASLEYIAKGAEEFDGIRFLVRMSLPDTTKPPKGQKVIYNGAEYTITDYGTLSAKKSDYEANGDSALEKKTAEKIQDTTENFADYLVSFRKLDDRNQEYVVKGYLELSPAGTGEPVTIFTELYSGSIASVAEKMQ